MNIIPVYNNLIFEQYKSKIPEDLLRSHNVIYDIILLLEHNGETVGHVIGFYDKIFQNEKYVEIIVHVDKESRGRALSKRTSLSLAAYNLLKSVHRTNPKLQGHVGIMGKLINKKLSSRIIDRLTMEEIVSNNNRYCLKKF